ncbi:unnamed protein product [Phytomonas sp. EM1]|nr:unnamed protein product [Phytomonas sp. EM1]|eukprot:CCW61386.1 unnamed protein product [Phytomonas sp. isolate EM1]
MEKTTNKEGECDSRRFNSSEATLKETPPDLRAEKEASASARPKTRLLRDVESEENKFIYNALYKSPDDAVNEQIKEALTTSDMLRDMTHSREAFQKAVSMSMSEKSKGCAQLITQLRSPRSQHVVKVFIGFSVAMLTLPIVVLLFGMRYLASWLGMDSVVCGGFASLGCVVVLMASYTIYAFIEDTSPSSFHPVATEAGDKKRN